MPVAAESLPAAEADAEKPAREYGYSECPDGMIALANFFTHQQIDLKNYDQLLEEALRGIPGNAEIRHHQIETDTPESAARAKARLNSLLLTSQAFWRDTKEGGREAASDTADILITTPPLPDSYNVFPVQPYIDKNMRFDPAMLDRYLIRQQQRVHAAQVRA